MSMGAGQGQGGRPPQTVLPYQPPNLLNRKEPPLSVHAPTLGGKVFT